MVIVLGLDNSLMFSIKVVGLKSEEFKKKNKKNKLPVSLFLHSLQCSSKCVPPELWVIHVVTLWNLLVLVKNQPFLHRFVRWLIYYFSTRGSEGVGFKMLVLVQFQTSKCQN